jgi:hypothetical protein
MNMTHFNAQSIAIANSSRVINVPRRYLLRLGCPHGDIHSSAWTPPLFEPRKPGCPFMLFRV